MSEHKTGDNECEPWERLPTSEEFRADLEGREYCRIDKRDDGDIGCECSIDTGTHRDHSPNSDVKETNSEGD